MPVSVERHLDVSVPHHRLDRLDIRPRVDRPSCTRVTERVEINPLVIAVDRLQKVALVCGIRG